MNRAGDAMITKSTHDFFNLLYLGSDHLLFLKIGSIKNVSRMVEIISLTLFQLCIEAIRVSTR